MVFWVLLHSSLDRYEIGLWMSCAPLEIEARGIRFYKALIKSGTAHAYWSGETYSIPQGCYLHLVLG